jgi:hypothetical protein
VPIKNEWPHSQRKAVKTSSGVKRLIRWTSTGKTRDDWHLGQLADVGTNRMAPDWGWSIGRIVSINARRENKRTACLARPQVIIRKENAGSPLARGKADLPGELPESQALVVIAAILLTFAARREMRHRCGGAVWSKRRADGSKANLTTHPLRLQRPWNLGNSQKSEAQHGGHLSDAGRFLGGE